MYSAPHCSTFLQSADSYRESLAYAEMRLILAKLIWKFDIKLSEQSRDWCSQSRVFMAWQKEPLHVYLTPREVTTNLRR